MTPKPQYGLVDFWKNLWETIGPYCQNTMRFHNPFGRGIKRFDVKPMNGLCDRYQVNRTVGDIRLVGAFYFIVDAFMDERICNLRFIRIGSMYASEKIGQMNSRLAIPSATIPCQIMSGVRLLRKS